MLPQRAPWSSFPSVSLQATQSRVLAHSAYLAASAGNSDAAADLVSSFFDPSHLPVPPDSTDFVVPVLRSGSNHAIVFALAAVTATFLGARVCSSVQETTQFEPSPELSLTRLVNQPVFSGTPPTGRCLIVSDHVSLGSDIANLRGFLMHHGCVVSSACALTADFTAAGLAPSPDTIQATRKRFELEKSLLVSVFGFEPECLTSREAFFLYSLPSLSLLLEPSQHFTIEYLQAHEGFKTAVKRYSS